MIDISQKNKIILKDKKVVIVGLGLSGSEAAKLANYLGAKVFATDNGVKKAIHHNAMNLMHKYHIPVETGIHSERIYDADLWVVSPGIPKKSKVILRAKNKKIPIVSEVEFASWFTKSSIIAITGSNGKTTTSSILYEMLKTHEKNTVLAGNMGIPLSKRVLNEILKPKNNVIYVLEISSFQMEFIKHFSPKIVIYTNISPDHLDRHKTMQEYINIKMMTAKNLKSDGFIVFNLDDKELRKSISANPKQLIPYSILKKDTLFYINDNIIFGPLNKRLMKVKEVSLNGQHNLYNFLAAATCSILLNIPMNQIIKTMKKFNGIEHRLEYVGKFNNIKYINDSKATNINSVIVALEAFQDPLILILGGYNKGTNFRLLLPHIKSNNVKYIIAYGDAGEHINTVLGDAVRSRRVSDLNSAVKLAQSKAAPGDIVLLSPGCASYDQFENFEERGNYFKKFVKNVESAC
ncbi:MAG: UDP-N-acetylmuramoyl-L-alanine--D-glutamate ligase [Candidatus Neomarinimicrobiota bacterium]